MHLGLFAFFENPAGDTAAALRDQLDLIRHAETIGMREAWLSEHHFNPYSVAGPILPLMGYALAATRTLTIGSAAVLLPYHSPIHVAEAVAALDILSNGRVAFGIAKGAFPLDDRHFKADPHTNGTVMREAMGLIDRLLTGEAVTHKGEWYALEEARLVPVPTRPIPRYLATFGSEESIAYAAQNNMGLLLSQTASLETIRKAIEAYTRHTGGRKPVVNVLRMLYTESDDNAAIKGANRAAQRFASAMKGVKSGSFAPVREEAFKALPMSDYGIVGSEARCCELLKEYKALGVDGLMLRPAGETCEINRTMMETIQHVAKGL